MTKMIMDGKRMRGLVLVLSGLAMGGLTAMAQDAGTAPPAQAEQHGGPMGGHRDPAQMEARQIEHMTKKLNLTTEQVAQVKLIDDAQRTQMMALRDDTSTPREEKRSKMMAMRQDAETKIRAVLTDDQKPKFDEMLAQQKARMEHGRGGQGGRPDAPPSPPPAN